MGVNANEEELMKGMPSQGESSRVRTYRVEKDGQRTSGAFTEAHAHSMGVPLEKDGMSLQHAIKLVKGWNAKGKSSGYRYSIPLVPTKHTDA